MAKNAVDSVWNVTCFFLRVDNIVKSLALLRYYHCYTARADRGKFNSILDFGHYVKVWVIVKGCFLLPFWSRDRQPCYPMGEHKLVFLRHAANSVFRLTTRGKLLFLSKNLTFFISGNSLQISAVVIVASAQFWWAETNKCHRPTEWVGTWKPVDWPSFWCCNR